MVDGAPKHFDSAQESRLNVAGLHRIGFAGLASPYLALAIFALITVVAAFGIGRLKVDDSLSELFRSDTKEFHQYEEIDRRFPSSEYDVLVVVEGKNLLKREQLAALGEAAIELQFVDGVQGIVSMLSARGKPDATGYAPPIVPDELPEDPAAYDEVIKTLRGNDIVKGKFLSDDGELALIVLALDRKVVQDLSAKTVIGHINEALEPILEPVGLRFKLTGAPVMQLEIRNAVERDRMVYNGLGLLFGALIAAIFFSRISLMLVAALPPFIAIVWTLGLLGWLGYKLNLFLNVMTPLIMVMGFSDSMQMTSAIRQRLREGDTRMEAARFAVRVVGPACVLAAATALIAFLALLLSQSGLIRTFGSAGAIATVISYLACLLVLPVLAVVLIRNEDKLSKAAAPADRLMDGLTNFVGTIVDHVVRRPVFYTLLGWGLLALFYWSFANLEARYRLADQVPDREQALEASASLDNKLTGANPVHVMIQWPKQDNLYDPGTLDVIGKAHTILEKEAGLGNVWSIDSLRRWLAETGDTSIETVKKYVGILPKHLVRRFIDKDERAVLVTARLPDIDASQILPVVETIDTALDPLRKAHPEFEIAVTGLPAIAARNSHSMIADLKDKIPACVVLAALILGLAFRSSFVSLMTFLPGLFPVVAASAVLYIFGFGIEFASVVGLIVVFGIGIDSLIHFMNRLKIQEDLGEPPEQAIRSARILVGPAIILTTIVLAFCLGVTVFSDLPSLRLFGFVCGLTLMASIVGDLVFLPATVFLGRKLWPVRPNAGNSSVHGNLTNQK